MMRLMGCAALTILVASGARADNWPRFFGENGTGIATGVAPSAASSVAAAFPMPCVLPQTKAFLFSSERFIAGYKAKVK